MSQPTAEDDIPRYRYMKERSRILRLIRAAEQLRASVTDLRYTPLTPHGEALACAALESYRTELTVLDMNWISQQKKRSK